jgi:hypothetical protein
MARAPSSPIPLPPKLHNIIYNIHYDCTRYIIITVQSIIYTGFGGCHTHYILLIVALTLSASAMARAPLSPILFHLKLHNIIYNIHYDCTRYIIITVQSIIYIHRIRWMPYSLYFGYCRIDLERLRNGSRAFVSNTITPQAA